MTVPLAAALLAPRSVPSTEDPVVAAAAKLLGGPPGRHARLADPHFFSVTRVLLVLTLLTCGLGWAAKAGCRNGSNWQHEYQYTRLCYTDVVALYGAEGLAQGRHPYYDHPVEYPVVIGGVMELTAQLAVGLTAVLPDDHATASARARLRAATTARQRQLATAEASYAEANARGRHFYDLSWLLLTGCALVVTVATARSAGRRPWDAALFALSPALLLHGTTNWDLVAVALAAAGLLAWARCRPWAAGVLLGLGAATKLYPVLFMLPLAALCWRAGRLRAWSLTAAGLLVTVAALTLPVYVTAPSYVERGGTVVRVAGSPLSRFGAQGLAALAPHAGGGVNAVYTFFELSRTRAADWDSLYLQAQRLRPGTLAAVPALNRSVALLELLVAAAVLALILCASRRPRLPQVLFLSLAGFLLANKVDSPQYVLWLVPLAVLARPRWGPFLCWQATEVLVLLSRFYFFIQNDKPNEGIAIGWFFAAVLLRDAVLLCYAAAVVRDVLRSERDVVRAGGVDDPAGGVLDGAVDRRPASRLSRV